MSRQAGTIGPFAKGLFIFIFSVFIVAPYAHALDWQAYHPLPTPSEIHDAYSPDGSTIYMVGNGGLILKYDGTDFTTMDTPTNLPLFAIDGTGSNDIWAVGGSVYTDAVTDRGVVLHYDGSTWSEVAPPLLGQYVLSDVYVVSTTLAWAVMADSNSVAKWDGYTWSSVSTLPSLTEGFRKVSGAGENAVWFVGDINQMAFWNGTSFTDITKDPSLGYVDFTTCWAADSNTLYTGSDSGAISRWTASGVETAISNDGGAKTISGIAHDDSGNVYFLGYYGFLVKLVGDTGVQETGVSDTIRRNTMVKRLSGEWVVGGDSVVESFDGSAVSVIGQESTLTPNVEFPFMVYDDGLWIVPDSLNDTLGITYISQSGQSAVMPPAGSNWSVIGAYYTGTEFVVGVYDWGSFEATAYRYSNSTWTEWQPDTSYHALYGGDTSSSGDEYVLLGTSSFGSGTGGAPCKVENGVAVCSGELEYRDLAVCGDTVYAVGNGGRIVSYDGSSWTTETSGTTKNLTGVACSANHVYAVGEDRVALWKSTGAWDAVTGIQERSGFDFTDVVNVGGDNFAASLIGYGPIGSTYYSYLYSMSSGAGTQDAGWIGPSSLDALAYNGETVFTSGRSGILMYAGTEPHFGPVSQQHGYLPAIYLLLLN